MGSWVIYSQVNFHAYSGSKLLRLIEHRLPTKMRSTEWSGEGQPPDALLLAIYLECIVEMPPAPEAEELDYLRRSLPSSIPTAPPLTPKEKLTAIFPNKDEAGLLFEVLAQLGWVANTSKAFRKFKSAFSDQDESQNQPSGPAATNAPKPIASPLRLYRDALGEALACGNKIDASQLGLTAHKRILKTLCLRHYGSNIDSLMADFDALVSEESSDALPDAARRSLDSIMRKIIPSLREDFDRQQQYNQPASLRLKLSGYQISAVCDAIFGEYGILGLEMGLGITLTALAVCESLKLPRVLYVTDSANREDLREEILKSLDISADQLGVISPETAHQSSEELADWLSNKRYLVIGVQTLRHFAAQNPELYRKISEWPGADGGLVVSEAHELDNAKSGRSLAVAGITAGVKIYESGSLYQHTPHKTATLLKAAYPETFPDLDDLIRKCRDPLVLKSLIARHVCSFFASDVIKNFLPASQVPFAEQLATGEPHMPRAIDHPAISIPMPMEYAELYVAFGLANDNWLIENGFGRHLLGHNPAWASRRRHASQKYALYEPHKLGLERPYWLLNAIKPAILEKLQEGEKVIIYCTHLSLIDLMLEDADLKSFGVVGLDGRTPAEGRTKLRHRIEDDPTVRCAVLQTQASAKGANFRSIDSIFYIELPAVFSLFPQSRSRALRALVGLEDLPYARSEVNIHRFVFTLPEEMKERLREIGLKEHELLTISARAEERTRKRMEMNDFVRRQVGLGDIDGPAQLRLYRDSLIRAAKRLALRGEGLGLMPHVLVPRGARTIPDYNNPVKREFREKELAFALRHLGDRNGRAHVFGLVGPEALEIEVFNALGFRESNIWAFEGGRADERATFWKHVQGRNYRAFGLRVEEALLHLDQPFKLVSYDNDGPLSVIDFDNVRRLRLETPRAVLIKNALTREGKYEGARALLDLFGCEKPLSQRRMLVDQYLLRLVGTAHLHPLGEISGPDALKLMFRADQLAAQVAQQISKRIALDQNTLARLLVDTYFGSPGLIEEESFTYTSPAGGTFLTKFAALDTDETFRDTPLGLAIRDLMHTILTTDSPTICQASLAQVITLISANLDSFRPKAYPTQTAQYAYE